MTDTPPEQPTFVIDDLTVRPWRPEDADAVYAACQDPEILRWTPLPRPYQKEHADRFVGTYAPTAWSDRSAAVFGVFDTTSGELLGSMGLVRLNLTAGTAELGYWTAPWARQRGVATRAGRALASWATETLGVSRVEWRADVGNHASRLVARRIGFTIEGVLANGLTAIAGSGRCDGWIGGLRPGEVSSATPAHLASGSTAALRAATFAGEPPNLALDGADGRLRTLAEHDIPLLVRAAADPDMIRWTTIPTPYGPDGGASYVRRARDEWLRGDGIVRVIAGPDDGYAGAIDFSISRDDDAVGEIGFSVAPWARGRGLAPAAARTLCAWAFDALGVTRVIWRAHVGNVASRRAAEKAGFTVEGTARGALEHRGARLDAWVGALLSTDPRSGATS
jgi:RimJ/RimL family protein N-acetyltransferase